MSMCEAKCEMRLSTIIQIMLKNIQFSLGAKNLKINILE